jgi:hypothetical protein
VEVILLPKNSEWINNPPEALERMANVLDRIGQETGVSIKNYQHLKQITPDMFEDTTHLAEFYGDEVFTQFLADTYAERLR